jgi:hypothetical protein
MIDMFHCKKINETALSRSACGARHERKIGQTCATCEVGRQHARGALPTHWGDGTEIRTALVTPHTMASLKIHLAIIEAYEAPPLRGRRLVGLTIREHAEQAGLTAEQVRVRLNRGESIETALSTTPRRNDRRVSHVRALARQLRRPPGTVCRWLKRGMSVEEIMGRCA